MAVRQPRSIEGSSCRSDSPGYGSDHAGLVHSRSSARERRPDCSRRKLPEYALKCIFKCSVRGWWSKRGQYNTQILLMTKFKNYAGLLGDTFCKRRIRTLACSSKLTRACRHDEQLNALRGHDACILRDVSTVF
uniref:Uncharacterized protein n=1 Tax=Trichogramma kaykai TaxID=54128 RepID=A0ABD2VUQ4_9HYME